MGHQPVTITFFICLFVYRIFVCSVDPKGFRCQRMQCALLGCSFFWSLGCESMGDVPFAALWRSAHLSPLVSLSSPCFCGQLLVAFCFCSTALLQISREVMRLITAMLN